MKILLDTHILIWATANTGLLPKKARQLIEDADNELYFSAISIFEVALKNGLQAADFRLDAARLRSGLLAAGYVELPVTGEHAAAIGGLPFWHKDPFDRLLLSQAQCENIKLLTADRRLAKYDVPMIFVRR
ncbi:twitching motility protein PilT [Planctomycetales bacterium]|nr:twitching motility protein PilT [Planctomycetales bacterium]GHS98479.1 twitching motility protein PilT [Planctomycetales bacterium]GHT05870.1 twitching motility protein PilT [Planctomycetales bacterium]